MVIIIDTNIWISQLGLNSPIGSALRFFAKQKSAKFALPYVIKLETETHLREELIKYVDTISKSYRELLTIFGRLKEITLPTNDEIEGKIQGIFANLGVEIIEIPFTFESAISSFNKIINKEPPNADKNQQFKDGVIWADCLKLLEHDNVYLVTEDKGFYKDREHNKGLADNLKIESSNFDNEIKIFPSLVLFLTLEMQI